MSQIELELYRQHRIIQQKYVYFLLAAVGACVGFAMTQTKDASLSMLQIPLGVAIAMWGISFYSGCKHITSTELTIYANMGLVKLQAGRDPIAGRNLEAIQMGDETIREAIKGHGTRAVSTGRWQFRCFIVGVLAYVVWHTLEMWAKGLS